jgi:molecular chaperone DnaJ
MSKDYYKILGVEKNASDDDIKKAYRKMAKKYHPDANPNNSEAENKFKEAAEAYETLGDSQKRSNYDRFGSSSNPFGGGAGSSGFGYSMDDIFSQFGDIFGDSFGKRYGGGSQRRTQRGSDLRIKVTLTIVDILNGVNKKLKYKRQVTCQSCNGEGGTDVRNCIPCNGLGRRTVVQNTPFGQIRQETGCPDCNGSGKQVANKCGVCQGHGTNLKEEIVDVDIPAGVTNGMQLNMRGYGNHIRGGVPGDLQIMIDELREFYFKRDDNNLIVEKEISVIDSILGADLKVKTPHGDLPITIDPGTEHGRKIRISGKGIPDMNLGLGDLFVNISIKIPKEITSEEREILESLKKTKSFNVN